jgi:RNA polymerase sigma factor (sigma-70 family)
MNRPPYLANERELLIRTARADQSAFAALYNFYYPLLATYIFRITRMQTLADEITQDVFLKIWINREALTRIVHFRTYLGTLSHNAALNELRNLQRKAVRHKLWERENADMPVCDILLPGQEEPLAHIDIDRAIEQLPQRQRYAYILARRQHLKYAQIAEKMHLTPGTVKRYLQLASTNIARHIRSQIFDWSVLFIILGMGL